jgi:prenyltransferase beta subunit
MKCRMIRASLVCLAFIAPALATPPDREPAGPKKDAPNMITPGARKAIDIGLTYLAKEQANDGSWGTGQYQGNVAVTSLAGLALLSGSHLPDRGDHGKAVTKAVRYLLSQESKDTAGFFNGKHPFHGPMYGHGFTVLFLADAYGNIPDKKLKAEVKEALERAVKLIVAAQNQEGGWRYQPRPQDADLSVTAGQIVALRAARDAGFKVPQATFDKAADYVKSCQDKNSGGFRYQAFGGQPAFARSAAGFTVLHRLDVKDPAIIGKSMDYLRRTGQPKQMDAGREPVPGAVLAMPVMHYSYGHYYAAKAM